MFVFGFSAEDSLVVCVRGRDDSIIPLSSGHQLPLCGRHHWSPAQTRGHRSQGSTCGKSIFPFIHSHFVAYNFGPTHTHVYIRLNLLFRLWLSWTFCIILRFLLILERCFKVCPGDKAKVKMLVLLAKVVFNDIYFPLEVNLFGRSVRSPYFKSAVIAFKYYFFL